MRKSEWQTIYASIFCIKAANVLLGIVSKYGHELRYHDISDIIEMAWSDRLLLKVFICLQDCLSLGLSQL